MNVKQLIEQTNKRRTLRFNVPSWGFDVCVRSWSAKELEDLDAMKEEAALKSFAIVAARSLCDEDGNLFFPDEETAVPMLMQKDMSALHLIAEKVAELNGSFRGPANKG